MKEAGWATGIERCHYVKKRREGTVQGQEGRGKRGGVRGHLA